MNVAKIHRPTNRHTSDLYRSAAIGCTTAPRLSGAPPLHRYASGLPRRGAIRRRCTTAPPLYGVGTLPLRRYRLTTRLHRSIRSAAIRPTCTTPPPLDTAHYRSAARRRTTAPLLDGALPLRRYTAEVHYCSTATRHGPTTASRLYSGGELVAPQLYGALYRSAAISTA